MSSYSYRATPPYCGGALLDDRRLVAAAVIGVGGPIAVAERSSVDAEAGLDAERIEYGTGYDLHKDSTFERL